MPVTAAVTVAWRGCQFAIPNRRYAGRLAIWYSSELKNPPPPSSRHLAPDRRYERVGDVVQDRRCPRCPTAACWQTGVQLLPTWRRRPCIHRCADNKPCPPHSISPMPASTRRRRDGSAHWRRRLAYFPWRRFSRADRRKRSFTLRSSPIPSGSNPAMSAECSEEEVSQLRAKLSPASTRPSPIAWLCSFGPSPDPRGAPRLHSSSLASLGLPVPVLASPSPARVLAMISRPSPEPARANSPAVTIRRLRPPRSTRRTQFRPVGGARRVRDT